jgi:hypothetical protein
LLKGTASELAEKHRFGFIGRNPGLKPLYIADSFTGLKAGAPSEKQQRAFPQAEKPRP